MKIDLMYSDNLGILTVEQLTTVSAQNVLLVGCGGIGGHMAHQLIRLGVKALTLVDFDRFTERNLNRQLFSDQTNIGFYKVDVIKKALLLIQPKATIKVYKKPIEDLDANFLADFDCLIDAVDSPLTKAYLNEMADQVKKPLLHGACAGWYAQLAWIEPGCMLIKELYDKQTQGLESDLLNPPFTPSLVASYMIAEFVKYLTDKRYATINELRLIDLKNNMLSSTGRCESDG